MLTLDGEPSKEGCYTWTNDTTTTHYIARRFVALNKLRQIIFSFFKSTKPNLLLDTIRRYHYVISYLIALNIHPYHWFPMFQSQKKIVQLQFLLNYSRTSKCQIFNDSKPIFGQWTLLFYLNVLIKCIK